MDNPIIRTGTYGELSQEPEQIQQPEQTVEQVVEQEQVAEQPTEQVQEEQPAQQPEVHEPITEVQSAQPKEESTKTQTWDEVLRNSGFDDKIVDALKYYQEHGDLHPYLEAKSVDYTQMSPEEVMRHDLRAQYKGLSDEEFDLLYQAEVVERFKLDRDVYDADSREAKLGVLQLKLASDQARNKLVEQQQKFYIPAKDTQAEAQRQQEEIERQMKAFNEFISGHAETKKILTDKRLVIGSGDQTFNFAVTPEKLIEQVNSPEKFWSKFQTPTGETDLGKVYRTMAYSENPEAYDKALIEYGKSLAAKEIIDQELHNVQPAKEVTPAVQQESLADAFRRATHRTYGG